MVLIAAWQASEKSKSSPCSIEKKSCSLSFYFSDESIQKLSIFLTVVLIKGAQNCLQTNLNFSLWLAVGYIFFFLLDACRGVQVKSCMSSPKKTHSRSGNKSWGSALLPKIPRSKHFYLFLYLKVVWDLSRCSIWSLFNPY